MKERIKWSPRYQHWYHVQSAGFFTSSDRRSLNFVLEINRLNGRRN